MDEYIAGIARLKTLDEMRQLTQTNAAALIRLDKVAPELRDKIEMALAEKRHQIEAAQRIAPLLQVFHHPADVVAPALIGVVLALIVARSTLNIFSIIGFIMLMGLVTKNAILLVDFANHARKAGATVAEALLQAGLIRMRPIIMTTAAMVFGMLPMALALNDGGEIQAPMGRAIIGGARPTAGRGAAR